MARTPTARFLTRTPPIAAFTMLLLAAAAHATTYNPPIRMSHGVEYMSGGIGSDEAQLMRTVEPRWPASFEFAMAEGQRADFAANVKVTVRKDNGEVVLDQVLSGGPIMVVRLDPGRYTVEAAFDGKVLSRQILVNAGSSTHSVFEWPAGAGVSTASTQ
ncbi:hypothetical protein [Variovorax sp.]|uniref:hypothetical protein n=1 Tax=Variovorax sp. TaxID=1871043 RepID=UPI002D46C514|nr:hypothetical protein [Variovorax sp.]HYP82426.1 hypothetical protein [Variovorax sp.]